MERSDRRLARYRRWLRLVAPLVPASRRRVWLEEWRGELASGLALDRPPSVWTLTRDASGALADALCLAREPWRIDVMLEDLKHAWRTLVRHPAFTVLAVLTLAVGLGVTTAILSVVDVVLLRPLPYPQPDRLVALWESNAERGWQQASAAPANALDWREATTALDDIAFHMYSPQDFIFAADIGDAVRARGLEVSGNFFDVLGVPPALGRPLRWQETWQTSAAALVLAHDFWQRSFGALEDVVGSTVRVDGEPVVVVGVMPSGFEAPGGPVDFWSSLAWDPADRDAVWFRRAHFVWPFARLAEGTTLEQARAEIEVIAGRLESVYPETNVAMGAGMTPLQAWQTGDARLPLLVLLGAVAMVLLIACANVANLLLVRSARRGREMAVRRALGAGRLRLTRQLFAEGLLLAAAAAAAGVISARGMVAVLKALAPAELPRLAGVAVDARVVGLAAVLALVSTLLFALAPAWIGTRDGGGLRSRGGGDRDHHGTRTRGLLVIAEVALALALLVGLGLLLRSLGEMYNVDLGFEPEGLVAVGVELPAAMFPDDETTSSAVRRAGLFGRLEAQIAALPGVVSVASATGLPVTGERWTSDYAVAGRPREDFGVGVGHVEVSPGLFRTLRTPLVAGRDLTPADDADAPGVVLVNQAFADEAFAGQDPLGARVSFDRYPDGDSNWYTIVGVVADLRHERVVDLPRPMIYQPLAQDPSGDRYLVIRSGGDPAAVVPAVREAVRAIDPALPLMKVATFDALIADSVANERLVTLLLAIFGGLAAVLAMVGTYGTIAFVTDQRRRELAVRMAVGARATDIVRLVIAGGLRWIGLGLAGGLALAFVGTRFLGTLLFETDAADPLVYLVIASLLAATGLFACWLPARRAALADPLANLRAE